MSAANRTDRSRTTAAAVVATDLRKSYGDLDAFSCDELVIAEGESVVLVGHNGSGKSTLLGLVTGTLDPTEGSVTVFGHEPQSLEARAELAWLPDTPILYDDLSVMEHLEYTSRLHGGTGDEPLLGELVQTLGLAGREHDLPVQFSRGLRQKTAVAIALCRPFGLLCIDEPFVGLDASGRAALLDLLDRARAAGATLLVATHDPAVLERFDRAVVLEQGEIIHDGTVEDAGALLSPETTGHGE